MVGLAIAAALVVVWFVLAADGRGGDLVHLLLLAAVAAPLVGLRRERGRG